jgi:protocatechuate 3,4-dioxygenase beta subunit
MTSETHEPEDHDLGLQHDLTELSEQRSRSWGRRGLLGLMGGLGVAGVAVVAGCAVDDSTTTAGSSSTTGSAGVPPGGPGGAPPDGGMAGDSTVEVADGEIPEETAGPYPGDGSNGPNVLTESGIVRSDITTSFGDASGVAEGVPTKVRLRVYDLSGDDITPMAGAAIYLWHCDREGRYSMYSDGVTDENYLRGVQEADDDGWLEFTTVFPACYDGRWPHLHFEVYESPAKATSADNKLRTSQLALPPATCAEVYDNVEGYEASVDNFAQVSLDTDGIFSDGYSLQLPKVTGSVDDGYTVTLNVPV